MEEKFGKNVDFHPQDKKKEASKEEKIIQLIVFHLGDEEFGADIDQVREIIRAGLITPIPDSPDFIKGVTNVRGEIAVVIDLKKRFFLRMKKDIEEKHIIMKEQEKNLFGLMVDEVTEVLRIPQTDIKQTPGLVTKIDRIYISGVLTLENRLIMILDLEKVLSEEELTKLSEFRIKHRPSIERVREHVSADEDEKSSVFAESEPVGAKFVKSRKEATVEKETKRGRKKKQIKT